MRHRSMAAAAAALASIVFALPMGAGAQEAGSVSLRTPYPGVLVEPGDTASFDFQVESTTTRQLVIEVGGVPEGWSTSVRGGGAEISRVTAGPDGSGSFELDVVVATDAAEGAYPLTVRVGEAALDVEVVVRAGAGGDVTLTPEFPGLRGASDATFTFSVEVANGTPQDVQLELGAEGPEGWRVDARPTGESQASTVAVESGSSARVTVEANPPIGVQAGEYEVTMSVTGGGVEQSLPLIVQIVGNVAVELSTPDQRLNASVSAGEATEIPVVVANVGSAPLVGVELSATPPRGWDVTFDPQTIPQMSAGEALAVTATVTPSAEAIAGDYRITFRSTVDQAQDSVEIRAQVEPSAAWGLVGVGVIALTLGGLAAIFRVYGRR